MTKTINRIGIVTGAANGIGSAIAKKLIAHLDGLILIDIDENKLTEFKKYLTSASAISCEAYYCDVGDTYSVNNMLDKAITKMGVPNIIINNAGIGGPFHKIDEVSDDEWFSIINTNLKSVFNLSRVLLPKMKQQRYGRIVNIASIQGYLGAARSSTYVASKHGVIGYTRSIAAEWGPHGITCNAVCPGYVGTQMGIQTEVIKNHQLKVIEKTPLERIASPEEIADFVVHLTKDESSFINGAILTIDGGLTCHLGVS